MEMTGSASASHHIDLMWQVIECAAHHMHTSLAGQAFQKWQQRARAKIVHRDEYGPGTHREGLPETKSLRQLLRTKRHLSNLLGLLNAGASVSHPAVVALRAAVLHDGKLCPQMALACCLCRKGPDKAELEMAVGRGAHR